MRIRIVFVLISTGIFLQSHVLYAQAPGRIISLDLCTDWMLLKYVEHARVTAFSPLLYRYQADWVPDGLPTHDGSLEQILEFDPDLLIAGEYNAILLRKRLNQLGRNVKVLPLPGGLDSIRDYQRKFLSIVQLSQRGNEPNWDIQYPQRSQTLLLLGANGIGTGRNTLENDLIERAGWTNYIRRNGYVDLRLEDIVADPPDAIYWSAPLSNSLANLFAEHAAIRKVVQKFKTPELENWRWECPGPWSLQLIEELAQWNG